MRALVSRLKEWFNCVDPDENMTNLTQVVDVVDVVEDSVGTDVVIEVWIYWGCVKMKQRVM